MIVSEKFYLIHILIYDLLNKWTISKTVVFSIFKSLILSLLEHAIQAILVLLSSVIHALYAYRPYGERFVTKFTRIRTYSL